MTAPALARLSLRIRVTLAIAAAMAALLAALSAFLVLRLASRLDLAVREGLESRAADLAALVQSTPADRRRSGHDQATNRSTGA